ACSRYEPSQKVVLQSGDRLAAKSGPARKLQTAGPFRPLARHSADSSGLDTRKQVLSDHRVHAPISIHHLRNAEVDGDSHQRDGFVLAQLFGGHQEMAHLTERV